MFIQSFYRNVFEYSIILYIKFVYIVYITPYSGKFWIGAHFRIFRMMPRRTKIKSTESFTFQIQIHVKYKCTCQTSGRGILACARTKIRIRKFILKAYGHLYKNLQLPKFPAIRYIILYEFYLFLLTIFRSLSLFFFSLSLIQQSHHYV